MNDLPHRFNDWHVVLGHHLGRTGAVVLCAAAAVALLLSFWALWGERRRGRAALLMLLRSGALAACLVVALEPALELREVTGVPNHVAILVDASRSMDVRPPDGGPSRAERAAALVRKAAPTFAAWQAEGQHRVDLFTFGETVAPATLDSLAGGRPTTGGAAPAPTPGPAAAAGRGPAESPPAADATRIGEALGDVRARYAGRDLGGVIVISDGIDTGRLGAGPLDAETEATLKALDAPVHTVGIGERELRDLSVSAVLADEFAFVRTPVKIEAIVRQSGLPNRRVDVTLARDGRAIDARTVELRGDHQEQKIAFDWVPDQPGSFVFEIATPVLGGEALASNNSQVFTLKVIRDRVRILHLCGRPSWDERFLRSMLRRDPNVDLVSFFILRTQHDEQPWNKNELSLIPFPTQEIFDEQLRTFDLVIFQNFNYAPYGVEPYLPGLRDYVESGGALAMIGGDLSLASGGYASTPLRTVLPVELDPGGSDFEERSLADDHTLALDAFRPKVTPEGRGHPVTSLSLDPHENEARWTALPPLEGWNRVRKLRAGATALLAHPTARDGSGKPAPILAVAQAGKGRTLALMTDTAWNWGFPAAGAGDDGRAFQRFWENAIHWLVRDPALTLLRVELDRVEYRRAQSPAARVRTLRPDYTPAAGVAVELELRDADHPDRVVRSYSTTTNEEGEAQVDVGLLGAGAYRLTGRATLETGPATEEKTFLVRAEGRELEDVAYRPKVLREIAEAGGGEMRDGGDLQGLAIRPPREVRVGRQQTVELWSHPLLMLAGLALLASEWFVRRRSGHA